MVRHTHTHTHTYRHMHMHGLACKLFYSPLCPCASHDVREMAAYHVCLCVPVCVLRHRWDTQAPPASCCIAELKGRKATPTCMQLMRSSAGGHTLVMGDDAGTLQ